MKQSLHILSTGADQQAFFDQVDPSKFYLLEYDTIAEPVLSREVDQIELAAISESHTILVGYTYVKLKKEEIDLNRQELFSTISKYKQEVDALAREEDAFTLDPTALFVNINRAFINYINSCRIFIDHLDVKIKRTYKNEPELSKVLKKITSYCYDTYFSYRFIYHLRNYAIHEDYPIDAIRVTNDTSDGKVKLLIDFKKSKLLESEKMASKLKLDLRLRNEFFPVLPIIDEFENSLAHLFSQIISIQKPFFVAHANRIKEIYNSKKTNKKNVAIISYKEGSNGNIPFSSTLLKIELATEIIDLLS